MAESFPVLWGIAAAVMKSVLASG